MESKNPMQKAVSKTEQTTHTTHVAECVEGCGVVAERGTPNAAFDAASRHYRATGHQTVPCEGGQ